MKKIILSATIFVAGLFSFAQVNANSEKELRFKYKANDNYRILSTVSEDVFVNGLANHHAEILNRISVRVTKTDGKKGWNEAVFMTSEDSTGTFGKKFAWGEEYESKFWRDEKGYYDISDEYFMPVVRDVPVFPEKKVKIGDTWTAEGHEAHDLRRTFEIEKPFKVPFTATYKYERDEGKLNVITVQYNLYAENPVPPNASVLQDYIVATMGFSRQTIYWDNEKGQIDHYNENFRISMETARGLVYDFTGNAKAEVTEFQRTATEEKLAEVRKTVERMGLENVTVQKSDKGLTISIENIQFKADSAILLDSEKMKLSQLAKILSNYPDNDLLVSGHTALAGTEKARQELSEQRADSVADYLVGLGVKDKYHIFTQGFGGRIPIASNKTEAGKAKNRRVEITILDR